MTFLNFLLKDNTIHKNAIFPSHNKDIGKDGLGHSGFVLLCCSCLCLIIYLSTSHPAIHPSLLLIYQCFITQMLPKEGDTVVSKHRHGLCPHATIVYMDARLSL